MTEILCTGLSAVRFEKYIFCNSCLLLCLASIAPSAGRLPGQSLQAIIENLLDVNDDDPLVTWIEENGIKSAKDFCALTRQAILTWTYQKIIPADANNTATKLDSTLNAGEQGCVKCAIWYLYHLEQTQCKDAVIPYADLGVYAFR